MTRPKVDPQNRQRTVRACEGCKRRKQKCNGVCPCSTCEKRGLLCVYGTNDRPSDDSWSGKRRLPEGEAAAPGRASSSGSPRSHPPQAHSPGVAPPPSTQWGRSRLDETERAAGAPLSDDVGRDDHGPPPPSSTESAVSSGGLFPACRELEAEEAPSMSRATTQSGNDEEAVMYTYTRMLQDPSGRLLYVGDSATLSFLQLMRMIVESVAGPSPFTTDPRRHRIVENSLSLPQGVRYTHVLPDRKTADVLVASFLMNTQGMLEVFDRTAFYSTLEASYSDPLSIDPPWLCLLNLVLAIGLVLAAFAPGTYESEVIEKLRSDPLDRAEIFYLNAKSLCDPIAGFEDVGFWSIQALLLMTVYMLAVSKRNAAFALFGMAVRSAFALGLHREETMVLYSHEQQEIRRSLWRSLFVFDRFLSASMGRPMAISEDDCSDEVLKGPEMSTSPLDNVYADIGVMALQASVQSAQIIGNILRRVYQARKISTKLAQEIAEACRLWPTSIAPVLHWRQARSSGPEQGIAILHVNLFYCHSIILLTRPFFLFLLNSKVNRFGNTADQARPRRKARRMEKFATACVAASTQSIMLVRDAFAGGYLPQRNPFVIYFLFTASLIILSNEFSGVCAISNVGLCIDGAVTIMTYCGETDPQAERMLYIITTFRDVVHSRQAASQAAPASSSTTATTSTTANNPPPATVLPSPYPATTVSNSPNPILPGSAWTRQGSFSVDLGNLMTPLTGASDDSLPADEPIHFDAFWNCPPASTPVVDAAAAAAAAATSTFNLATSADPAFVHHPAGLNMSAAVVGCSATGGVATGDNG